MKRFVILALLLLVSSVCSAKEFTAYLQWETEPRIYTSVENIPGENGEDLHAWTFGWNYITVWQPDNPVQTQWSLIDPTTHYSTVGSAAIRFETLSLNNFRSDLPFAVVASINNGSVEEWPNQGDTQGYSAFAYADVSVLDLQVGFVMDYLFWDLRD